MFDATPHARIFGVSLGADFPKEVVKGVLARASGLAPHEIAQITIYVNTRRMARRMTELFFEGGARLHPQIRLITDLGKDPAFATGQTEADPLARRLELAQLVRKLIDAQPELAPPAAAFDLADSLAALMDEMQSEGVPPERLSTLNVDAHSEYWARSLKFIELVQGFVKDDAILDTEANQRRVVMELVARWKSDAPTKPIIVAGSTGSRATTRLLMEAVARLPQGAVILPGFDFEMPLSVWDALEQKADHRKGESSQDHPQYRFKALMDALDLPLAELRAWSDEAGVNKPRNALVSLALNPAPVTDEWIARGPHLPELATATQTITLVEAPSARAEAVTIAYGMREALDAGKTVALITPDRILTRQVTAALKRWSIIPDDSAGTPLGLSAPGRLLRQTAALMGDQIAAEDLLALLKHPLVANHADQDRGAHLQNTRDLELGCLRGGPPFITRDVLEAWLEKHRTRNEALHPWIDWVSSLIEALQQVEAGPLAQLEEDHRAISERFCAGPDASGSGELWLKAAGEAALKEMNLLRKAAPSGGDMSPREYRDLLGSIISRGEVRDAVSVDSRAMIWGTLESRVQGADMLILAGLNDGVWPEAPSPDPWLNRAMREEAGLLLPERNLGLSAHDFQQAVTAPDVWITRSKRSADAETVPSRWLNRLRNLLEGLPESGAPALAAMQKRGDEYLARAALLEAPDRLDDPAPRPSPQPPLAARPKALSVTRIEKLIRDPYAIYARYVLDLAPLRALSATADAPLRGQVIHDVLERFVHETKDGLGPDPLSHLMQITDAILEEDVSWPSVQHMWRARFARSAPWFIQTEEARRAEGKPLQLRDKLAVEMTVSAKLDTPEFELSGRIDRVDQLHDGRLVVYDYKTGSLPGKEQEQHFNKQLPLLAAMINQTGISGETGFQVARTSYLGLGSAPEERTKPVTDAELDTVWEDFARLIAEYADETQGYTARRAVFEARFDQDYDHLARYGEWSETNDPVPMRVGQ